MVAVKALLSLEVFKVEAVLGSEELSLSIAAHTVLELQAL